MFQEVHEDTLARIHEANPRGKEIVSMTSGDEEKKNKLQISTKRKNAESDKISQKKPRKEADTDEVNPQSKEIVLISNGEEKKNKLQISGKSENAQSDQISRKPRKKSLQTLSTFGRPILDTPQISCTEITSARREVIKKVRIFREIYTELLPREVHGAVNGVRIDTLAHKLFKECFCADDGEKFLGDVPGVDSGDEFNMRVELGIVGLHRQLQAGIDFLKYNGKYVAISVVSTGRCADDKSNSDILLYAGTGVAFDEVAGRGNVALKNSMEENTPVRVIRGFKKRRYTEKSIVRYVYDGLYLVEKFWRQNSKLGHKILMFQLRRIIPVSVTDISGGQEPLPIPIVNYTDEPVQIHFNYVSKLMYPSTYVLAPPRGCTCTNACTALCECAAKNEARELPYTDTGRITRVRKVVYECGPACGCPPTCPNRVTQQGIKIRLEVFKTAKSGYGVRSPDFIPSGTFICEYVGEILTEEEANKIANDEYIFSIGMTSKKGFAIDGRKYGNVGRFINHSCSPNLYAQNVFYDHQSSSLPRVMFFAAEDIEPMKELSYDYNYNCGEVYDVNGNLKYKECFCGSSECKGRLY